MTDRIISVCQGNNAKLMAYHVAPLWIDKESDHVLDLTFGLGKWWIGFMPDHFTGIKGNFTRLSKAHRWRFDVVVYDPPYVSIGGRNTQRPTGREMSRRYGMDMTGKSPYENKLLIDKGFGQGWRALVENGLLIVKCADYISSGKFVQGHKDVIEMAAKRGMEQVDEFIHFSGTGPQPLVRGGEPLVQVHSHRAHSFLCVFRKRL